jgi:secreted PhoX family phosphatase
MKSVGRRGFLGGSAGVVGASLVGAPLFVEALANASAAAADGRSLGRAGRGSGGYGPLAAKRPVRTPTFSPEFGGVYADASTDWLALPEGFHYVVVGIAGTVMSDGYRTPSAHDGMGAFRAGHRRVRLVRNHENRNTADAGLPPIGGPGSDRSGPCPSSGSTSTTPTRQTAARRPYTTRASARVGPSSGGSRAAGSI